MRWWSGWPGPARTRFGCAAAAFGMLIASTAFTCSANAQDDDFGQTPYVPTPQSVVDRMLDVAKVGPADYVIDLGSGDGRLVITAATRYHARGFGVDLYTRLVARSNANAKAAGVSDRAVFYARDLYETDLSVATVVTIYLLPEVNLMVRPKLLATLKPGTRIVSHDYGMGEWTPDEQMVLDVPDKPVGRDKASKVFYYVVPANAAGKWRWQLPLGAKPAEVELSVTQNFQMVSGTLLVDGKAWPIENPRLRGTQLTFTARDQAAATRYDFAGSVDGEAIAGTVHVSGPKVERQTEWQAKRSQFAQPAHALLKKPDLLEIKKQFEDRYPN